MNKETSASSMNLVEFYLGPGGVGKTTVSALNAIKKSLEGEKVLIATFDPSMRLKDVLLSEKGFQDINLKNNLEVVILNPKLIFEDLLRSIDNDLANSIKKNRLFAQLIERVNGVQEFSSLYFLNQQIYNKKYNLIIIDTPPLQNAIDFFSSPAKLQSLFESAVVKIFVGEFNKNWFEKLFKKSRDLALNTLKKLTGSDFFEDLLSFMKALEELNPIITSTLKGSQKILDAKSTSYNFVTAYEKNNLYYALAQIKLFKEQGILYNKIFINKFNGRHLKTFDHKNKISDFRDNDKLSDFQEAVSWCQNQGFIKTSEYIRLLLDKEKSNHKLLLEIAEHYNSIFLLDAYDVRNSEEEDLIAISKGFYEFSKAT